jgi:hypothetical protein
MCSRECGARPLILTSEAASPAAFYWVGWSVPRIRRVRRAREVQRLASIPISRSRVHAGWPSAAARRRHPHLLELRATS